MKFSILAFLGLALIQTKKIYKSSKKTQQNNDDDDDFEDTYYSNALVPTYNDYYSQHHTTNSKKTSTKKNSKSNRNQNDQSESDQFPNVKLFKKTNNQDDSQESESNDFSKQGYGFFNGLNGWQINSKGKSYPITAIEYNGHKVNTGSNHRNQNEDSSSDSQSSLETRNGRYSRKVKTTRNSNNRRGRRTNNNNGRTYRLQVGNYNWHPIRQQFKFGSRTKKSQNSYKISNKKSKNYDDSQDSTEQQFSLPTRYFPKQSSTTRRQYPGFALDYDDESQVQIKKTKKTAKKTTKGKKKAVKKAAKKVAKKVVKSETKTSE